MIEQAVILAGGRGERLRPLTDQLPKPLVPVLGRPFIDRLIDQLQSQGIRRILILTGYRGDQIAEHVAMQTRIGWPEVTCRRTADEWGTGQRLDEAVECLDERFLLCYGDVYAPVCLAELEKRHDEAGRAVTISVAGRRGANIALDDKGNVDDYVVGCNHVDIGYSVVNKPDSSSRFAFNWAGELISLIDDNLLAAHDPGLFHHTITDSTSLREMENYFRPKRMILLDRDGTLNERAAPGEYVTTKEQWKWRERVIDQLVRLANVGFTFAVCTNQPAVARGVMTLQDLSELSDWIAGEAYRRWGIRICTTCFCEHDRDSLCKCRKPAPKTLYDACNKHQLSRTIFIGDEDRDSEAARRACIPFLHADAFTADGVLETFRGWEANP